MIQKYLKKRGTGFTLIETLVAISLLTIAIVAPMSLTAQSLASAYYARDEVTSYYLAQEAIEAVRSIRDGQILQIAQSTNASSLNIFGPIPVNTPFIIDARQSNPAQAISNCNSDPYDGTCPPLQTDGTFYGYQTGWTNTNFTRTVVACYVEASGPCGSTATDEMRVTVTVTWQTAAIKARTFSISEDLYRWIADGSGVS